jgi:hypothetical protein
VGPDVRGRKGEGPQLTPFIGAGLRYSLLNYKYFLCGYILESVGREKSVPARTRLIT